MADVYMPSISDEAVCAKTGHNWDHWFELLDRWGAKRKTHRDIARHLHDERGVSAWWSQMVTGEYEKSRGLRAAVGQQCDTDKFQAQVQRTVSAPAADVYRAFATTKGLRAWLGAGAAVQAKEGGTLVLPSLGEGTLRIVEKSKRLRMHFNGRGAAKSTLEITVEAKNADKCVVRLQHTNIGTEAAYRRFKKLWTQALDALRKEFGGK